MGWFSTYGKKSQWVRLIDILFYGPFLIFVATQLDNIYIEVIVLLMGASTITYNLSNYIYEM